MKNILIVLVAVIVLLPIGGMAHSTNESVTEFSVSTTYIGFDNNWFSSNILVNIISIENNGDTPLRIELLKGRDDYINRTVVANMMKVNKSTNIGTADIGTLENKTANISEKEKLSIADNKDNHTYIIIGSILSVIAIIISVCVIIRNRKFYRKFYRK